MLGLGLCGIGTVGGSLVRMLDELGPGSGCELKAYSARRKRKELEKLSYFQNPVDMASADDIDLVVELIGGTEVAAEIARATLKKGKHLVTANKALLKEQGEELFDLADRNKSALRFEAAVAGAVPVVRMLREHLSHLPISSVRGIINGTCNFVLSNMEKYASEFSVEVEKAKAKGYAEADPGYDIEGIDAAHKMAILARLAYGLPLESQEFNVEGINMISRADVEAAGRHGYSIKHLGMAAPRQDKLEMSVHPAMVPKSHPLAVVSGTGNSIEIVVEGGVGSLVLSGAGAGGPETASAVFSDICSIADTFSESREIPAGGMKTLKPKELQIGKPEEGISRFYLRFQIPEEVHYFSKVAESLSGLGIAVESAEKKVATDFDEHSCLEIFTRSTSLGHLDQAISKLLEDKRIILGQRLRILG